MSDVLTGEDEDDIDIVEVEKIMAPAARYRRAFNVAEIES